MELRVFNVIQLQGVILAVSLMHRNVQHVLSGKLYRIMSVRYHVHLSAILVQVLLSVLVVSKDMELTVQDIAYHA